MDSRLDSLLSRYSLGIKHLAEPGPTAEELQDIVQAALRAPDHAGLVPWRLVCVAGQARQRLAELFSQIALESGKDAAGAQLDAERAARAPVTLALIARIDMGHPLVPAHEQWVAVGGALANLMNALHALGYAGKMLSGNKARHPAVAAAFCGPGEMLVGWIAIGTPTRAVSDRKAKAGLETVLSQWS
jgi:nitroreductase